MISDEELEKLATSYALGISNSVKCPACGEDSLWNNHSKDFKAGYRKYEAMNNQNEIRLLRKIENLIIENEKLRDRLFGGGK